MTSEECKGNKNGKVSKEEKLKGLSPHSNGNWKCKKNGKSDLEKEKY